MFRTRFIAVVGAAVGLLAGTQFFDALRAAPVQPDNPDAANSPASEQPAVKPPAAEDPTAPSPALTASYEQGFLPFLKQYCADCHGDGAHKGDFRFDQYRDVEALKRDRHIWTKALKLLKVGAMPPPDGDVPSAEERAQAVKWLDHQLFYCDCSRPPDPGRVKVRRLNRIEYNNTVRDLLRVDFRPADDFPADETGYGFDNLGDVLTVPPLLLEKFLDAAEQIADRAVRSHSPLHSRIRFAGKTLSAESRMVRRSFEFPRAGRYILRVEARSEGSGDDATKVEIRLGNSIVFAFEPKDTESSKVFETILDVQAGSPNVTAILTNTFDDAALAGRAASGSDRKLHVGYIEVEGPLGFTDDERRAQPFVRVLPEGKVTAVDAARANLKEFLPRAFRRAVSTRRMRSLRRSRPTGARAWRLVRTGDESHAAGGAGVAAVFVSGGRQFSAGGGRRGAR